MKSLSFAHCFAIAQLFVSSLVRAQPSCTTSSGSHSFQPVPTSTKTVSKVHTVQHTITSTSVITSTVQSYTTSTPTTTTWMITSVSTVAPATTTVPTSPGFTPIVSARHGQAPPYNNESESKRRSKPRSGRNGRPKARSSRAASTTRYAIKVNCVTTHTALTSKQLTYDSYTFTKTTIPGTDTFAYTINDTVTSKLTIHHTSVATLYQGCADPQNRMEKFDRVLILNFQDYSSKYDIGYSSIGSNYGGLGVAGFAPSMLPRGFRSIVRRVDVE